VNLPKEEDFDRIIKRSLERFNIQADSKEYAEHILFDLMYRHHRLKLEEPEDGYLPAWAEQWEEFERYVFKSLSEIGYDCTGFKLVPVE